MPRESEMRPVAFANGEVVIIDQRRLPGRLVHLHLTTYEAVVEAIRSLAVRGAPAIGVAGAYAVVLAAQAAEQAGMDASDWSTYVRGAAEHIAQARPTAVNLSWAVGLMLDELAAGADTARLTAAALALAEADIIANHAIGLHGAQLLRGVETLLTHCNAGALATVGYGTALGVVRALHAERNLKMVYATETRPLQQGLRLTAWELRREAIPVSIIADSAGGWLLAQGRVAACVVGADRIAANGDVANKIGTYTLSVLAARHRVPFVVAAPLSTFDRAAGRGHDIAIEERSPAELTHYRGRRVAPRGVTAVNPAFDITPAELVTAIVTERGVLHPPYGRAIEAAFASRVQA